jgi:hypothetical protein
MENKNYLPQLGPYEVDEVKEIQDMANLQFPKFFLALDSLAAKDTTVLHKALQQHQNLCKKIQDLYLKFLTRFKSTTTLPKH